MPPSCCTGMKQSQIKLHWSFLQRKEPLVEQCILPDTQRSCSQMKETLEFLLKTNCLFKKTLWFEDSAFCTPCPTFFNACMQHLLLESPLHRDTAPCIPTSQRQLRKQANKSPFMEQASNSAPQKENCDFQAEGLADNKGNFLINNTKPVVSTSM